MSQKVVAVKGLSRNERNLRSVGSSYCNKNKGRISQRVSTYTNGIYRGIKSISSRVVCEISNITKNNTL